MVFGPVLKEKEGMPTPNFVIREAGYDDRGYRIIPYDSYRDRFCFKWPYQVILEIKEIDGIGEERTAMDFVCIQTSYQFNKRQKILKENGWHNSGPDLKKNCFYFSKKLPSGANSQWRVGLKWQGDMFIWVANGGLSEEDGLSQMDQVLNFIGLII